MELKIKKLIPSAIIPTRSHRDDAGLDLYSTEKVMMYFGKVVTMGTGIAIQIPHGFYGQICDRSGLGSKGIHVLGGIIDSCYRGEVKIVLTCVNRWIQSNTTIDLKYLINEGDRIAQLLIRPYKIVDVVEVEELNKTDREENGFGSSDTK